MQCYLWFWSAQQEFKLFKVGVKGVTGRLSRACGHFQLRPKAPDVVVVMPNVTQDTIKQIYEIVMAYYLPKENVF